MIIHDGLKRQHWDRSYTVHTVDLTVDFTLGGLALDRGDRVDRNVFGVERVDKMSADRIDGGPPFSSVVDIRLRRKNKI